MTGKIPSSVILKTSDPVKNIALGIQHLLAVYAKRSMSFEAIANSLVVSAELDHYKDRKPRELLKFIIQGRKNGRATKPSYLVDIVSRTLSLFSPLSVATGGQTSSWKRILRPNVEPGSYVIFFFVVPIKGEKMYDASRHNNGEYTQMAVLNTATRLLCPCNVNGSAFILGHDVEGMCNQDQRTTEIVNHLNSIVRGKTRGIYPMEGTGCRRVTLAGIYEISHGNVQETDVAENSGNDSPTDERNHGPPRARIYYPKA